MSAALRRDHAEVQRDPRGVGVVREGLVSTQIPIEAEALAISQIQRSKIPAIGRTLDPQRIGSEALVADGHPEVKFRGLVVVVAVVVQLPRRLDGWIIYPQRRCSLVYNATTLLRLSRYGFWIVPNNIHMHQYLPWRVQSRAL